MYNPDQQYQAHIFHLKELSAQAEQRRMIAGLAQHRHARIRAGGRRLGVVLVNLSMWLSRSATSSRPTLDMSREPHEWGKAVAILSSARGNIEEVCGAVS